MLSRASAHSASVHTAWPRALMFRRLGLCMCERDRMSTFTELNAKLVRSGLLPVELPRSYLKFGLEPCSTSRKEVSPSHWMVLEYHPVYMKSSLGQSFRSFLKSQGFSQLWQQCFPGSQCRLSWKNRLPNLSQLINTFLAETVQAGVGG